MKLRWVKVRETVRRLLDCAGLVEVTWETLSIIRLVLSSIRHVSCDVYQADYRRVRSSLSNYGSAVAVADQNAWSILESNDTLCGGDIFLEGCLRFLDDADVEAVFDEKVVNAFPAGTIGPGAVNQNDVANAMVFIVVTGRRGALR